MVDRSDWGRLAEELNKYSSIELSELCYLLDLNRSGTISEKIYRIQGSEFNYQQVINKLNFLKFGFNIFNYYSVNELNEIISENDLPNPPTKFDKIVEIIKSEEVTPRSLLGPLTLEQLHDLYFELTEDEQEREREDLIRAIIKHFDLKWMDKVMDLAFIIMPMTDDPEIESVCQTIKQECEKFDIHAKRIDDIETSGLITDEIRVAIKNSKYLFIDLTLERPNVYYEVGYCHGLEKDPRKIVFIAKYGTKLHFDIRNMRTIFYRQAILTGRLHKAAALCRMKGDFEYTNAYYTC